MRVGQSQLTNKVSGLLLKGFEMKKDTKISTSEFLLRFSWASIYFATQDQPVVFDKSFSSLSLEEMYEKMKKLDWAFEGGRYIRFRKLRDQWIKVYKELIKAQNG